MLLPGFSVIDKGGVVFQNTNTARNSNALNPSGKKTSSSSRASSFIASIFKPGGNQEGISQQQQQPQLVISNPVLVSSSAMNRTSPFQHFISGPRPQPNQPAITVTAASTCAHFAAHSPATTTETKKSLYTTTINAARSDSKLLNENEGKAALSNWATSNPINPAPTPTTTTTTITPEKDLISMGPATPIVSVYQPDLSSFARQYLSDKYTEAAKKQAAEAAEAGKGAMSSQELENLINSLRAKEDGGADVKSSNSASIHLSSWSPARAEKSETLIAQAASTRSILNPSGGAGGGMKKSVSIENLASEKKKSWAVAAAKSNNNITGVDSRVAGITTNTVSRSAGHSRSRSCEQKPPKAPPTPKKEQQQAAPTPSDLDSASSAAQRMEHLLSLARRGEAESTSTSTDSSNGILNLIDGY